MYYIRGVLLALIALQANAQDITQEEPLKASEAQVQQWIIKADSYRSPFTSGEFNTSLTLYKNSSKVETSKFFVQLNEQGDSRVTMLDKRSKGQKVLLTDRAMWLYIPRTRKAIRITPMQRLMGQASYGDVSSLNWQHEYQWDKSEITEQTINEQKSRCFMVKAIRKSATYRTIKLCLDSHSSRPIKADFYLASGKLMKQAAFHHSADSPEIIDQTIFTQPGKTNQYTIMHNSNYSQKTHKATLFTRQGFIKK